ncbi:FAD-dependent oxidoreductase [uncultured Sphaerochaeta sp.]|uniref:FAD-dependent oxidoreductase n=1 Tax=uncultured Sphaerochaeta sp. TaxID=886478 RepID=UPI002A0A784F|nr:FAD-dependent oxidoreductase [uncultured Sphaerochaeta sp.]
MKQLIEELRAKGELLLNPGRVDIAVGVGTCGLGNGAGELLKAISEEVASRKLDIQVRSVGCFGFCANEPLVNIHLPGLPLLILDKVQIEDLPWIFSSIEKRSFPKDRVLCKISEWDYLGAFSAFGKGFDSIPEWNEITYFRSQKKIVLRHAGLIDPTSLEEYLAVGGYSAFFKAVWEMSRDEVLQEVKDSKLRGRGGAGFPTGLKWELMNKNEAEKKFIICNADEGDPGAYMNRNEMESDPHMLIEGMLIGAYAMHTSRGIVYVRAEYPLAVERLKLAVQQAREVGLLGKKIPNTLFQFDIEIVEGAGAFVCGEETALIASVEGKAGRPTMKPPFPAQKGYLGYPTTINNLETWCNVPVIIGMGSSWFRKTGTSDSPGTKVFSLVGKVKNTGLVELPLGENFCTLIYEVGGGSSSPNKKIKAVQSGGPSGGCIPASKFDTPIDYESLQSLGAIMGSGGMVVMDQDNCMVDFARYFIEFTHKESCGKCVPCREGLSQELALLNGLVQGRGEEDDLAKMEELGLNICDTAVCGLGQSAPNPVLTTLRYFRDEYEEHIHRHHCSSGTCEDLISSLCSNSCPMHMNIPAYLQLLKENRLEEAFASTLQDNPLPGTIGRICHFHCQMRCRRDNIDEPVHQGEIHRYLADTMYKMGRESAIYKKLIDGKLPVTGKKIAIIGAGPAGLAAAFYLVRLGHQVTVFDSNEKAGGVLRYGIPSYRLPKEVLDKELELFDALKVNFVFNAELGKQFSLEELLKNYPTVILALGAYRHMALDIPGIELEGVLQGTDLLEKLEKEQPVSIGKRVVIVGGGNVAIDAARTLWRRGCEVTVAYRRAKEDMPANKSEIDEAIKEGIAFSFLSAPVQVIGNAKGKVEAFEFMEMKQGSYDLSGRRKPLDSGKVMRIPCDMVIVAIGEHVDSGLLIREGIATDSRKNACIERYSYKTNLAGVYAIGDLTTGPSTAAEAMGYAKDAAQVIDQELTGKKRFASLFETFTYSNEPPVEVPAGKGIPPRHLKVAERQGNFAEVNRGYMGEQARQEASRCLRCDICYAESKEVSNG